MSAHRQPLLLPQYGMGMTEATVVEWRKEVGERVEAGEVVVLLEASKAEVEMESPLTGTLAEIVVQPDETVPVQSVLAYVDVADD